MSDQPVSDESPDERAAGPGGDYGYDEAHDVSSEHMTGTHPAPHRVESPPIDPQAGGDYGYDEAHDFGAH